MNSLNKFTQEKENEVRKYIQAGRIASRVREEIRRMVKEDMLLIEICEFVEKRIMELGGKPAFPCNVSVNEIAAHYTSPPSDEKRIPENSLVKIDIGVHVDGYIADTAITVCFNPEYESMIYAAEKALEAAINMIRPGMFISKISSEIQMVIERYGFKPISNLTGHQIDRYLLHAGKSIPNISHFSLEKFSSKCVYAIEPFVTVKEAVGKVKDGSERYIFRLMKHRFSKKQDKAQLLLEYIKKNFGYLPFSERWLKKCFELENDYKQAFMKLLSSKCLMGYPILVEASLKPVAQAEHTVYVDDEDIIILTR